MLKMLITDITISVIIYAIIKCILQSTMINDKILRKIKSKKRSWVFVMLPKNPFKFKRVFERNFQLNFGLNFAQVLTQIHSGFYSLILNEDNFCYTR